MKIPQKQFKNAIEAVMPFVASRSTMPILESIKVESNGAAIKFTATNLDAQIEHSFECDGESLSGCIDAAALKKFAQFADEDISLTIKKGKAELKSGSAKARLDVLDAKDFPLLQKTQSIIAELDWAVVREKIGFASLFCAENDIRPVMNCVQITSSGTRIDIFGTNGLRLAMNDVAHIAPEFKVCIPIRSARRMVGDYTSFVVREDQIELRSTDTTAIFKLAPIKPTDGRRIVSSRLPDVGQVDRKSLLDAITFATAFHDGKLRSIVKIESSEHNSVQLIGAGNEAATTFEYDGQKFSFSVYASDFIDALKALDGEKVGFEFDSSSMETSQLRLLDDGRVICALPVKV
jgi:DNA polymerase III sliding clamp (beta) subunit (PCNA family)